ncbi:MAG: 30S ribosomal protein S4 [Dehalococcoidales bacterium]|nr:30S ribosomal protein S4 [Dehalococcoidales bacterium]
MARHITANCQLCRRCGDKLMLKGNRCMTPKCVMERRHKTMSSGSRGRRRRVSERGTQLIEKQKARYVYGLFERQFKRFFAEAARQPGVTGDNLKVMLERRLDNVIFRLGFADSRPQARQLVLHGHILVNGHRVNVPSYLVDEGDTIVCREASLKKEYFKKVIEEIKSKNIPTWLTLDRTKLAGQVVTLPVPDETVAQFDGKSIVEYYSR